MNHYHDQDRTGRTTQEQWAWEDCDEGPSVWTCPVCGEIYSEADEVLGKDGRAECPYCADDDLELVRMLDQRAAYLEGAITEGRGDIEAQRKEWRACQDEMKELEADHGTD